MADLARPSVSKGPTLSCGDRVTVGVANMQEIGTVKFCGQTSFSTGEWVGVALDKPLGKNKGTVKGVQYFQCEDNHGIFVRRANVVKVANVPAGEEAMGKCLSLVIPEGPVADAPRRTPKSRSSKDSREERRSEASQPRQSVQAQQAQKQLAEAIEERDIGRIRASLIKANADGGVSQKEIQMAQQVLQYEDKKNMIKDLDRVRDAVTKLAESVRRAEDRALQVEQAAKAGLQAATIDSAQMAIKAWMTQCVERIERSVWLSLETKVEEKVRRAISQAMGDKVPVEQIQAAIPSLAPAAQPAGDKKAEIAKKEAQQEETAVIKIQKAFRLLAARSDCKDKNISRAAVVARRRHKAWAAIFDENAGLSGLQEGTLCVALRQIYPRFTKRQVSAIFDGYTNGTGSVDVDLAGFVAICEAAATGDRDVAEFADLCAEDFASLKDAPEGDPNHAAVKIQSITRGHQSRKRIEAPSNRAGDNKKIQEAIRRDPSIAATKIQSLHRGSVIRGQFQDQKAAVVKIQRALRMATARLRTKGRSISGYAYALRKRHGAWSDIYDEAVKSQGGDPDGLEYEYFRQALCSIHPQLSEAQCRALHNGYLNGTDQLAVNLVGFCGMVEAVFVGDSFAAEFADMSAEKFAGLAEVKPVIDALALDRASRKIQRLVRRNQARAKTEDLSIARAAILARRRHKAWASIFDEVCDKIKCGSMLSQEGFGAALLEIHPTIAMPQVRALWSGYTEGTGQDAVDLGGFCAMADAFSTGSKVAAEFADISVEAFEAFGVTGAEAAATKLQAAERGRRVRSSVAQNSKVPAG